MTNQEMFDTVVAHARKQGCRALNGTVCMYRTSSGHKCFIGALIPDNKYKPEFEQCGLIGLTKDPESYEYNKALAVAQTAGVLEDQYIFAMELQKIHDVFNEYVWETQFQKLSEKYNLTYTPPTI